MPRPYTRHSRVRVSFTAAPQNRLVTDVRTKICAENQHKQKDNNFSFANTITDSHALRDGAVMVREDSRVQMAGFSAG